MTTKPAFAVDQLSDSQVPVFIGGLRTPFGRAFKGVYAEVRPDDLLVELLNAQSGASTTQTAWQSFDRNQLWSKIEDLIVGCAYPEGEQGYNMGRMVALGAGLNVPGMTVNRLCASSLESVAIAAARVRSGWGDCFLVAGIESMSRIPRRGANFSESEAIKARTPAAYTPNGTTAENVARSHRNATREAQEDLAARSHTLAFQAYESGWYQKQIHPYLIDRDEFIRFPVNREKMASLKPAFEENGTVTAATSSPLTDGATSGWIVSRESAKAAGATHGLVVLDAAVSHVAPETMGIGPVPATQALFKRNQVGPEDISAVEINEAFAVQVLASISDLNLPLDQVNGWGGAMALGHPLGASGLRLVMTLHNRMAEDQTDGAIGLATLCVGGGQGMSVLFRYEKW